MEEAPEDNSPTTTVDADAPTARTMKKTKKKMKMIGMKMRMMMNSVMSMTTIMKMSMTTITMKMMRMKKTKIGMKKKTRKKKNAEEEAEEGLRVWIEKNSVKLHQGADVRLRVVAEVHPVVDVADLPVAVAKVLQMEEEVLKEVVLQEDHVVALMETVVVGSPVCLRENGVKSPQEEVALPTKEAEAAQKAEEALPEIEMVVQVQLQEEVLHEVEVLTEKAEVQEVVLQAEEAKHLQEDARLMAMDLLTDVQVVLMDDQVDQADVANLPMDVQAAADQVLLQVEAAAVQALLPVVLVPRQEADAHLPPQADEAALHLHHAAEVLPVEAREDLQPCHQPNAARSLQWADMHLMVVEEEVHQVMEKAEVVLLLPVADDNINSFIDRLRCSACLFLCFLLKI